MFYFQILCNWLCPSSIQKHHYDYLIILIYNPYPIFSCNWQTTNLGDDECEVLGGGRGLELLHAQERRHLIGQQAMDGRHRRRNPEYEHHWQLGDVRAGSMGEM